MNTNELNIDEFLSKMQKNKLYIEQIVRQLDMEFETNVERLTEYEYIDDLKGLQHGSFVRYINVEHRNNKGNHTLSNCFIFSDFEFSQNGTCLILKTFRNSVFKINVDKLLVFQKYSKDEMMLKALCSFIKNNEESESDDETASVVSNDK